MAALKASIDRKRYLADCIKEDFTNGKLYHSFYPDELQQLFLAFDKALGGEVVSDPPIYTVPSMEIEALLHAVIAFLRDDPVRTLELTSWLYPWSESSPALYEMITTAEYLVRCDVVPQNGPYLANQGRSLYCFCVSYPRSGNTMLTNLIDRFLPCSRHTVFWSDGRYVSRWARNVEAPGDIIVKDHHLCNLQLRNKIIYVVRQYPAVLKSLIVYLYRELAWLKHPDIKKIFSSLPEFLEYVKGEYEFGGWLEQVSSALDCLKTNGNVEIYKYEDLVGANCSDTFRNIFEYLGHVSPEANDISTAQANLYKVREALRAETPGWSPVGPGDQVPDLVRETSEPSLAAWLRRFPDSDRAAILQVHESAASRTLGYGAAIT